MRLTLPICFSAAFLLASCQARESVPVATEPSVQPIAQQAQFRDLGISDDNTSHQTTSALSLVQPDAELTVRKTMEKADWRYALEAERQALSQTEHGVVHTWQNQRTGWSGEVTGGILYGINGRQCREVIHIVNGHDTKQRFSIISCLRADGAWEKIASQRS